MAKVTCPVCFDEKHPRDIPKLTDNCRPTCTVCADCVKNHIESEVNTKGDLQVRCPTCRTDVDIRKVQQFGRPKDFERYDKLMLTKMLQELPEFRWCKKADCGSGQLHDGGDEYNVMTCHACQTVSCYSCDVLQHFGETCAEFQHRLRNDAGHAANQAYLQRRTKPCPQCHRRIEKNDGCDHMRCLEAAGGCGHEFCWRCLADYRPILNRGNHHHKPTCTYYAHYESSDDGDGGEEDDEDEDNDDEDSDEHDDDEDDDDEDDDDEGDDVISLSD